MENLKQLLMSSRLFNGIKEEELSAVLSCITYKTASYAMEQYVYIRGETINSIGMVLKGKAHIVQDDYWGNRSILAQVTAGDLFGETYAFSSNRPIDVSVVAEQGSEIIFFPFSRLITVCGSACLFHNRLIRNLLNIVAEKNLAMTRKMQYLSRRTTREKLLLYLSDECKKQGQQDFTIPFNRQQLADYLLVDRSAMSNELSKLKKEGIIDFHKNNFRLKSDKVID
ncbi:MAG: Crp/Fnr family transcriptional regulator [Clostridiales bacterium]|nr:Crp/Fnr family transcriptional regulator [Clostridiales bacterium]